MSTAVNDHPKVAEWPQTICLARSGLNMFRVHGGEEEAAELQRQGLETRLYVPAPAIAAEIEQLRGVDRGSPQHLVIADRLEAILEGREAA